jgi:hypothetical protein
LEDRSLISLCSAFVPSFFTITSVGSFNRTYRHAMNVVPSVCIRTRTPYILRTYSMKFSSFVFKRKKNDFIVLMKVRTYINKSMFYSRSDHGNDDKKTMKMLQDGQINQEYLSIFLFLQ